MEREGMKEKKKRKQSRRGKMKQIKGEKKECEI